MNKKIRLTHIDGKLPNLALMKLSHWHKSLGDNITLTRSVRPRLIETKYDVIYGSSIFTYSKSHIDTLRGYYPDAIIGGTGSLNLKTVEELINENEYEYYDYSIYPEFEYSLGFTQRGCRLNCSFCVVPKKEGKPRSVNTVNQIWRGNENRCIILLDNDFFGQPKEQWIARMDEILEGNFKVSFNQGINIRLIGEDEAQWIAKVPYYDDQFKVKRIYTAWDRLQDEKIFFKGLNNLINAGISSRHVMVYMLIGYAVDETWDEIFYRFNKIKDSGALPYPMVYNNKNKELKKFQRWVVRRYHEFISWDEYKK